MRAVIFREDGVKVVPDDEHASPLALAQRQIEKLQFLLNGEKTEFRRLVRDLERAEQDLDIERQRTIELYRDEVDIVELIKDLDDIEASLNKAEHHALAAKVSPAIVANISFLRARRASRLRDIRALFED